MSYKMPTTKEEFIHEHRKMWTWIAYETLRRQDKVSKEMYLNKIGVEGLYSDCWLCEYVYVAKNKVIGNCKDCPLQWVDADGNKDDNYCGHANSLFQEWCDEEDYKKSFEIAYKIANLQPKKGE